MSDELLPRLRELFAAALRVSPEKREAFVSEACGSDRQLRARLESLLGFHDRGKGFLEEPVLGTTFTFPGTPPGAGGGQPNLEGTRLGRYEVGPLVGSGGMSSVYLAHRADAEFQKQVAVKVIKPGMDTDVVIRRFRIERQVLASLDHPNIARLLDGGTTGDGRPYLIMEFIDGEPIDSYCDTRGLGIAARLELFSAVCSAVQYAHRQLVLHRDLKPANILVTSEGEPKLLDFGIAKLLDPELSSSFTTVTTGTQRFFTPEYASPEQIRGEPVSTSTDIYSLGVVLYELLTGHRPYSLTARAPHELERVICEQEPTRPSSVIFRVKEIPARGGEVRTLSPETVARAREVRPEKLRRQLAGDLDTIVLMALRKEPERRYVSAQQFAEDLRRHMRGLPVTARKDTLRYLSVKFLSRNRTAVVIILLVLAMLVGGILVALRDAVQEARSQRLAARRVQEFLVALHDEPRGIRSRRDQFLVALEEGEADRVAAALREQPGELVQFADTVARVCERVHVADAAATWRREALRVRRDELGARGRELADAHYRLARPLHRAGELAGAEQHLRSAVELCRASPEGDGVSLAEILRELATVLWDRGDLETPRALFEESLGLDLAVATLIDFAEFLQSRGDDGEAENRLRQALEVAAGASPEDRPVLEASVRHRLGRLLWHTPRFGEAEIELRRAVSTFLRFLPETDPRLAAARNDLALVLALPRSGLQGLAVWESPFVELWRAARDRRLEVFGAESIEMADSLYTLALTLSPVDAEPRLRRSLELYRRRWPEGHPELAAPLTRLGHCLNRPQNPALSEGEDLLRRALEIRRRSLPPGHWKIAETSYLLGYNLSVQGRHEEAMSLLEEGHRRLAATHGVHHSLTGSAFWLLIRHLEIRGDGKRAAALTRENEANRRPWPFTRHFRDDDGSLETHAALDFEDDHLEKRIRIDGDPRGASCARLWILGQAYSSGWGDIRDARKDNFRIRVNHEPDREIAFNASLKFLFLRSLQWVPFEVPLDWLVEGDNHFAIYKAHDPDWKTAHSWQYNNLRVAIDTDTVERNRSWWISGLEYCCREIVERAEAAEKPLSRSSPIIADHRETGFRECQGELMVFLELCDD